MQFLKNDKGFTLVELAIVLVIIGIILGAVIKGQDLIQNAKAKKVASLFQQWETSIYTHYDRKGFLPGDTNSPKDGFMDGYAAVTASLSAANIYYPGELAGYTFSILGTTGNVCGYNSGGNYILITVPPELRATELLEAIDLAIDGTASGVSGRLRACGGNGLLGTPGAWTAASSTLNYRLY